MGWDTDESHFCYTGVQLTLIDELQHAAGFGMKRLVITTNIYLTQWHFEKPTRPKKFWENLQNLQTIYAAISAPED